MGVGLSTLFILANLQHPATFEWQSENNFGKNMYNILNITALEKLKL